VLKAFNKFPKLAKEFFESPMEFLISAKKSFIEAEKKFISDQYFSSFFFHRNFSPENLQELQEKNQVSI